MDKQKRTETKAVRWRLLPYQMGKSISFAFLRGGEKHDRYMGYIIPLCISSL